MRVISLNKDQVTELYQKSYVKDFPAAERKPLSMLLKGMDRGTYQCLGLLNEQEEIISYAYFVQKGQDFLFDYFAVLDGGRNKGIGSQFLSLIAEFFKDADSVIGEVEDPAYAQSEEDRDLQTRRLHFYLRNGYLDTKIRVKLFGVDYIVLQLDNGKIMDKKQVSDLYKAHYKAFLPWIMYIANVKVKRV